MTKQRNHGDGGIDARGENSWRLRYRINGRRFTKTVHGTKTEAQKALRDLLHAGDIGGHVPPDKMTLGQWMAIDRSAWQQAPARSRATVYRAIRRTSPRSCHACPGRAPIAAASIERD